MAPVSSLVFARVSLRPARLVLAAVLATVILGGCGSSHPRTQVLRSANPLTSDIYLRITGPGGAVNYIRQRFMTGGGFGKFRFNPADKAERSGSTGLFLPPRLRDQKLCASTHVIRPGDAPGLQKWRGRTLAVTVYGKKISAIFCAVLTSDLYLAGTAQSGA
jgi:hypothetical protein